MTTYRVVVNTADLDDAGTDANVSIELRGRLPDNSNKRSGLRPLDNNKDNFERGSHDEFSVDSEDLGEIKSIFLSHDNSGDQPGWLPTLVTVQNDETERLWICPCYRWLADDEDDGQTKRIVNATPDSETTQFRVDVVTGNKKGAGTDANVYLKIYGATYATDEVLLDNGTDNFEQNHTDSFFFELADLSELEKIRIRHDNSGRRPGWYLVRVMISNEKTGRRWAFPLGDSGGWLAMDEPPYTTQRVLYAVPQ